MKQFFQQLSLKQFKIITALLIISGDIIFLSYIYHNASQRSFVERELGRGLASQGMSLDEISPQDRDQAYQTIVNFLKASLAVFFTFHALLALLFYLGKKSPWKYFKYYSLVAALSLPFLMIVKFHVILLAAVPVYIAVTLGLFFRPWENVPIRA